MPEGDTIFKAARGLSQALTGKSITHFESVLPALMRVHEDAPLTGRTVEAVWSQGKHLLMRFSGDLILRTHMRMSGSWHLYRPNERWWRPRGQMRIALATADFVAVGFNIPVAEFHSERSLARELHSLGPDLMADEFDVDEALQRLIARGTLTLSNALLDQRVMAGIGNVFKSEILFVARRSPFALVSVYSRDELTSLIGTSRMLLRANATRQTGSGYRRTTRRADPRAKLWVYGRAGEPCRVCGTPVALTVQDPQARLTYWCPTCQPGPML